MLDGHLKQSKGRVRVLSAHRNWGPPPRTSDGKWYGHTEPVRIRALMGCWRNWHHASEVLAMYEADDAYRDTRDALAYEMDANGRYLRRRGTA